MSAAPSPAKSALGRRVGAALVAGASLVAAAGLASGALFTDSAQIPDSTFAFGSVDLTTTPTSRLFNLPTMAPGDSSVAPMTIHNAGTMELRYSAASTIDTAALGSALTLRVKSGLGSCTAAAMADSAQGTSLYSGALGSPSGTAVFGNPAQGAQAGDRVLAAGATETLCVQVGAPLSTGNAAQGLSGTGTFTFNAEQTANNA